MRLALTLPFLLLACRPPALPPGFRLGAAVAGFQVEAGCPTVPAADCEDRRSDWYELVTSPQALPGLASLVSFEALANAPGQWELYEADLRRAQAELKLDAFRFSIEWSRVFPTATDGLDGPALAAAAHRPTLQRYRRLLDTLRALGVTPVVTLNHYSLPSWLHDAVGCHRSLATCSRRGWLDRERAVREAARYARFVAEELGDEVDLWATLNEPLAVVLPGYLQPRAERVNPPGVALQFAAARDVLLALVEAHARMADAVRAGDQTDADGDGRSAQVGLVYNVTPTRPKDASRRADQVAAANVFTLYNSVFLDAVVTGQLDEDLDGRPDAPLPRPELVGRLDWLGVNYYTRIVVEAAEGPVFPQLSALTTFNPLTAAVEPFDPDGLLEALRHVGQRYPGLPVWVTETGIDLAGQPSLGPAWLARTLQATEHALAEGLDVRGYLYWSLLDNYEWNHGMKQRFGLYEVTADKQRVARPSVELFRDVAERRRLDERWLSGGP